MSVSSAGNWPPSGPYLPDGHSKSMISLPEAPGSSPTGRFYPPSDEMFPELPNQNSLEPKDASPPVLSPISKPSPRLSGGGLNYVW